MHRCKPQGAHPAYRYGTSHYDPSHFNSLVFSPAILRETLSCILYRQNDLCAVGFTPTLGAPGRYGGSSPSWIASAEPCWRLPNMVRRTCICPTKLPGSMTEGLMALR